MKKILSYIGLSILLFSIIFVLIFNNKNNFNNSVVYIESINEETITSGSGFVYKIEDGKNYIITSYHVIEGYSDIYVHNTSKEKVKAQILNYDEYTDIAILTIESKLKLKEINIGNSDTISVNDQIIAIGTPNNIENFNKINKGKINNSNKNITIETTHGSSNLEVIELSIDVTYGNSGGPLLNMNNEVIGVMFVKEDSKNVAYALPINFVMDIVTKLENHELIRPNLGAVMCNSTNIELLSEYEIKVEEVEGVVLLGLNNFGALYNSGLKKGDIITEFDGVIIKNVNKLREELYNHKVGNIIEIVYFREGSYYKVNVQL